MDRPSPPQIAGGTVPQAYSYMFKDHIYIYLYIYEVADKR